MDVMTGDDAWESLRFTASDQLEQRAQAFLSSHGLDPAFQAGLVAQMRQMLQSKRMALSVDIVDLI